MLDKLPLGAVLVGMIDRPGAALANVTAYPRWRWLVPVLLMILALAVSLALTASLLAIQTRQILAEQMARLPAAQASLIQTQIEQFQKPAVVIGTSFGSAMIAMLLGWLFQGVILYFGVLIAGGELGFKRVFAAVPWLSLPFAIELIVQAVFAATHGQLVINQGLSYLVSVGKPLDDMRNLTYVVLGQLTLFRLWHWILVYALLRKAARLTGSGAFALTAVYAAIGLGGQLALAALGSMLNPS